jgi:hypothetical protein
VFNNFTIIIEPRCVDARTLITARPNLMAMRNHHVVFSDCTFGMGGFGAIFDGHSFKAVDEPFFAFRDMRLVLGVAVAKPAALL